MRFLPPVRPVRRARRVPEPTAAEPMARTTAQDLQKLYADERTRRRGGISATLIIGPLIMLAPFIGPVLTAGPLHDRDDFLTRVRGTYTTFHNAKAIGEPLGPAVGILAIAVALTLSVTVGTSRNLMVLPTTTREVRSWYTHLALTRCADWTCLISGVGLLLGVPVLACADAAGRVGALVWMLAGFACLSMFNAIPPAFDPFLKHDQAQELLAAIDQQRSMILKQLGDQEAPEQVNHWNTLRVHGAAALLDWAMAVVVMALSILSMPGVTTHGWKLIYAVVATGTLVTLALTPVRWGALRLARTSPAPAFADRQTQVLECFTLVAAAIAFALSALVVPSTDPVVDRFTIALCIMTGLSLVANSILARWAPWRPLLLMRLSHLTTREASPKWVLEQLNNYEFDSVVKGKPFTTPR